ncbi:hypothetical protein FBU59_001209 [Linderina macrospora]|uniref:Uncharacterized protein n=1 Tax=Linderina macrospora TaxID=4868 RepID=A0ACC1JEW5_9FUNG|nr:hypothetical protein FBU59_001209 [Linderina macrospora]
MHIKAKIMTIAKRTSDKLRKIWPRRARKNCPAMLDSGAGTALVAKSAPAATTVGIIKDDNAGYFHSGSKDEILQCSLHIAMGRLRKIEKDELVRHMNEDENFRRTILTVLAADMAGSVPPGESAVSVINAVMALVSFTYKDKTPVPTAENVTSATPTTTADATESINIAHEMGTVYTGDNEHEATGQDESEVSGEDLLIEIPYLYDIETTADDDSMCIDIDIEGGTETVGDITPGDTAQDEGEPFDGEFLIGIPYIDDSESGTDYGSVMFAMEAETGTMYSETSVPESANEVQDETSAMDLLAEPPYLHDTETATDNGSETTDIDNREVTIAAGSIKPETATIASTEISDLELMMELPYYSGVVLSPAFNAKTDLAKAAAEAMATERQRPVSTDSHRTPVADNVGSAKAKGGKTGFWCAFAQKLAYVFPAGTDHYPGFHAWDTNHTLAA